MYVASGETKTTGSEIWSDRPAVVVSNDGLTQKSGFVNVAYMTTKPKRDMPYHVKVISGHKEATVLCEQIFPVDKSRIGSVLGRLTPEEILGVDRALRFTLGISDTLSCDSMIEKWLHAVDRYGLSIDGQLLNEERLPNGDYRRMVDCTISANTTVNGKIPVPKEITGYRKIREYIRSHFTSVIFDAPDFDPSSADIYIKEPESDGDVEM